MCLVVFFCQPERINPESGQKGYDIRSDVWSLGITMVSRARKSEDIEIEPEKCKVNKPRHVKVIQLECLVKPLVPDHLSGMRWSDEFYH